MRAPTLASNGALIPRIGLGTWRSAGGEAARAVEAALRAGYRHIDTAAMYDNEHDVGEGLRRSGVPRSEIFVTTKVWRDDIADGALQRSAEESLERLRLDHVDLLLIHWPNETVPLAESLGALCEVKRRGLTAHIGVSNFPATMLDEAVRLASEPLVVNQCEYHPRLDQTAVLAACARHGIAFTSYCPLGRGALTQDPTLEAIGRAHGKTAAQAILRWHVQQPGVAAVPKSATPERIEQNLDVFDFELSPAEMAAIDGLRRPDGRIVSPAFAPAWDRSA